MSTSDDLVTSRDRQCRARSSPTARVHDPRRAPAGPSLVGGRRTTDRADRAQPGRATPSTYGEGRDIEVRVAGNDDAVARHGPRPRGRAQGRRRGAGLQPVLARRSGAGHAPRAAPGSGCRSPGRTPSFTVAASRPGASRAREPVFRLTLPRRAGDRLATAPLPLSPTFADQVPAVGGPYARYPHREPGECAVTASRSACRRACLRSAWRCSRAPRACRSRTARR